MKKRFFVVFSILFFVVFCYAQQDPQYSFNMYNRLAVNPAYAGVNKALCTTTLYRNQWVGFKDDASGVSGAPRTGLISIDYGRFFKNKSGGAGLTVAQDNIGFTKTLSAKLAYSQHFMLDALNLAFGIDMGMLQQSLSGNFIAPDGSTSNTGGGIDPSIPWGGTSVITYDLGFGAYAYTGRMYIGLSSMHLPQQEASKAESTWKYVYKTARHYYIMAGYEVVKTPDWVITPSIFTKTVLASTQVDLNLMAKWKKNPNAAIFMGASYRVKDAIVAMAGIESRLSRYLSLKAGYAYDIPNSDLKNYNNGSHEIMLGFCYRLVPEGTMTSHMNVRFL